MGFTHSPYYIFEVVNMADKQYDIEERGIINCTGETIYLVNPYTGSVNTIEPACDITPNVNMGITYPYLDDEDCENIESITIYNKVEFPEVYGEENGKKIKLHPYMIVPPIVAKTYCVVRDDLLYIDYKKNSFIENGKLLVKALSDPLIV